jgi:UDP:flavonoid glycosyltransferase YjiC (YdhE family)
MLQAYTHGNYVLYADIPGLFGTRSLPANHSYIGPVFWSPEIPLPEWWRQLDDQKPIVYVSLGSSGPVHVLPNLVNVLNGLPITVILATAGRWQPKTLPPNFWCSDFLPGDEIVKRAKLVICNGGSPGVYQALRHRVPVLGIASNMDQHLMMQAVVREGAGILVRSDQATENSLQKAITLLLEDESYHLAASRLEIVIAQNSAEKKFAAFVATVSQNLAARGKNDSH